MKNLSNIFCCEWLYEYFFFGGKDGDQVNRARILRLKLMDIPDTHQKIGLYIRKGRV